MSPTAMMERLRARLALWFFAHFFRLLLLVASLSEWVVFWWVWPQRNTLPAAAWVCGPALIYAVNRWITLRSQRRRFLGGGTNSGPVQRLYYAAVFTSLFCVLVLLATGTLWLVTKVFVGALTAEARGVHVPTAIDSSVNTAFRWLADAGMAGVMVSFMYGYTVGQLRIRVRRMRLPLRDWPAALDGLRIVQISDIHIGQNLEPAQLDNFVERVNALAPDLICITGDIIDSPAADMAGFLPILARLTALHGVFAILGNHDHYAGADAVERALRRLTPFTVLRDQHVTADIRGARLHIIGVDDRGRDWARGVVSVPYLSAALAAVPAGEPLLLLSHRPDLFPQAAPRVALMLSGHTHGGQLGIPWFNGRVRNLAEFITAFDRGLFERNGAYLYVNCGLGVTGQRIRLSTPREITVIEAAAAPSGALAA